MPNRKGFTVLELIIYLGIIVSVLLINLMLITVIKSSHPDNVLFWQSFKKCWAESQQSARLNNCKYEVLIERAENQVEFIPFSPNAREQILKCPAQLVPYRARRLFINADGYSAPTTVYWYSKNNKTVYLQKFQLGWSGFKVDQKK